MTNTTKIIIGIIILIIVIIGIWYGVSKKPAEEEPIKIGVIVVLSGDAAIYGEDAKKGLDLALEEINKEGGVLGKKIELIYEDSRLDPKEAVTAMNKFINIDRLPIVIIAEGSGPTSAVAPLADSNKTLLMVSIASTPTIKDAGDYVFRTMLSDDYQAFKMIKVSKDLGFRSAAILYVNDTYGIGIKDVFSEGFEEFGNVIIKESFEGSATDFRAQLTKIKSSKPDVIIIVARKEFPLILKQAKELGLDSQIIASETLKDESLIKESGDAAESVLIPFVAEPLGYSEYKTKYKEKYEEEPVLYGNFSYDALRVLAIAIQNAGLIDSEKVKNALYDVVYEGASGLVKFDSNGEVIEKPFNMYKVVDGKIEEFNR